MTEPAKEIWPVVTLKEHFEKIIDLKEEALKLQASSSQIALSLQAKEYERRLDQLNGEYDRIQKNQATYVSYSVLATVISIGVALAAIYFRH